MNWGTDYHHNTYYFALTIVLYSHFLNLFDRLWCGYTCYSKDWKCRFHTKPAFYNCSIWWGILNIHLLNFPLSWKLFSIRTLLAMYEWYIHATHYLIQKIYKAPCWIPCVTGDPNCVVPYLYVLKLVLCCSFQAMVARGDLGAELPVEEVPSLQV